MFEDEVEHSPEEEDLLELVEHSPEEEDQLEQQEERMLEADQFASADEGENNIVDILPRRSPRTQRPAAQNANRQPAARRRAASARPTAAQRVTAMRNAIRSNGQDLEYKQKILRALTQITRSFEMVVEQQADTNLMFWQAVAAESRNLRPALYTQFKTEVIDKLAEYIRLNQQTFENEM